LSGGYGLTLKSQHDKEKEGVSPVDEAEDPPPKYTVNAEEWDVSMFEEQDFEFDPSKLSKSFTVAIETGDYAHVKLLLQGGESPLAENEDRWCAFHYAVRTDSKRIIRALLTSKQVQANHWGINKQDKNGDTPLHFAASLGRKTMVKELLEKGANVNIQNNNQRSPLFKAVEANHEEIVEILLVHKAQFLPVIPPPGSSVPKRFKEMKVAINHRKVQAKKGKV
jgi:ankyrin repeat protein